MALLGGEAEQTPCTTRFIVGMRMHHHEGMGFLGHRLLVCEPPHFAQGHARTDPPHQRWGAWWGLCRRWRALSRWSAAPRGSALGPRVHRRHACGHHPRLVEHASPLRSPWGDDGDGVHLSQQGWAWRAPRPAGPAAPAHSWWRPHAPCYRRCTRSGPSEPPLLPERRAPPAPRWGRLTRTSPVYHASGNIPASATDLGPLLPGPAPDRPLRAPPGTRTGAAPRPG